jgi:hypothetical protein
MSYPKATVIWQRTSTARLGSLNVEWKAVGRTCGSYSREENGKMRAHKRTKLATNTD